MTCSDRMRSGFTLIEVMLALSFLAVSVAVSGRLIAGSVTRLREAFTSEQRSAEAIWSFEDVFTACRPTVPGLRRTYLAIVERPSGASDTTMTALPC